MFKHRFLFLTHETFSTTYTKICHPVLLVVRGRVKVPKLLHGDQQGFLRMLFFILCQIIHVDSFCFILQFKSPLFELFQFVFKSRSQRLDFSLKHIPKSPIRPSLVGVIKSLMFPTNNPIFT